MGSPATSSRPPRRGVAADTLVTSLIGPIFLVLAAWFVWGPEGETPPSPDRVVVSPDRISSEPWRVAKDTPVMQVAGFDKKCMECHALFTSRPDSPMRPGSIPLNQHRNLVHAHGMNDRCFNCHDFDDRDALALPGGSTIPFGESSRLCATCHGTTYRDWERGMHGRTTGSWNAASGAQLRLSCVECHDPHAPAFGPMDALPGPDTLRMGPPTGRTSGHAGKKRNPLRQWSASETGEAPH